MKRILKIFVALLLIIFLYKYETISNSVEYDTNLLPKYNGKDYIVINNNNPFFTNEDKKLEPFETYSELDSLGRAGVAYALISVDTMPTYKRESISMIKPSGFRISKYDFIDGEYLFNRCHLIGFQLAGENANPKNLITCTRQMNASTMLEFENKVANYVRRTKHHVLYRVTPVYNGDNLIATGIYMEALSIEDNKIKFNVFIFNVQDRIEIDYSNGFNRLIA